MLEVEVKFRVRDRRALLKSLRSRNPDDEGSDDTHTDTLYTHPKVVLAGRVLRLRRYADGRAELTYKGTLLAMTPKTREEVNVALDNVHEAERLSRVLECLEFRPTLTYTKTRTSYAVFVTSRRRWVTVSLDTIDGVGDFAEVEATGGLDGSEAAVTEVARELGLTEVETKSYPQLVEEVRQRQTPERD